MTEKMKVLMRCTNCGQEEELPLDANRFCGSFGGLSPREELLRGRMIDPCRGTMLAEFEAPPEVTAPPLELKVESVDVSAKTYKVSKLWSGVQPWPWEHRAPHSQFDAYHYFFTSTGVPAVDNILKAVALAGKRYHDTNQWGDDDAEEGRSLADWIQEAADAAAKEFKKEMKGDAGDA